MSYIAPETFADVQVGDKVLFFLNDLPGSVLEIENITDDSDELLIFLRDDHSLVEKCPKLIWWANLQENFARPVRSKNEPKGMRVFILTVELLDKCIWQYSLKIKKSKSSFCIQALAYYTKMRCELLGEKPLLVV